MQTDDAKPKGVQVIAKAGRQRGRRPSKVTRPAPFDVATYNKLMAGLGAQGWYRELATRQRRAFIQRHSNPEGWPRLVKAFEDGFKPINDPQKMDSIMCRTESVAKVE